MKFALLSIAALVLSACASTAPTSSERMVVSEGVKDIVKESEDGSVRSDDERIRCKREQILGSNRRQRVCMTVAEWKARAELSQEVMLERDRRGTCASCGGDG